MAKRGSKKNGQPTESDSEAAPGPGHNGPEPLTDDQRQALMFQWKKKYESALAAQKAAAATFKNVCKQAKAELGDEAIDEIKDAIAYDTPEGEARIKAEIDRKLRVARWMAIPVSAFTQAELFADRTPAVDRAQAEGKKARLEGKPCKAPYDPSVPQHDAWIQGWHDGEKALIEAQKRDDAALFDQAPPTAADPAAIGTEPATHKTVN